MRGILYASFLFIKKDIKEDVIWKRIRIKRLTIIIVLDIDVIIVLKIAYARKQVKKQKNEVIILNINKCIRIKLTELSSKYDISLIEITSARNEKIGKIYKIILKSNDKTITNEFKNKTSLVSWLVCQH